MGLAKTLLPCFFETCETAFSFLETRHEFQKFSGMVDYHGGRKTIRPFRSENIPDEFWALTRYEKGSIAIEISFSENGWALESYIYFGFINRFNLSDILGAAKKSDKRLQTHYSITHRNDLITTLQNQGKAVKEYEKYFTAHNEKLIKRATIIRAKQTEHAIYELYARSMEIALKKAARAFVEKDYKRVVEYYKPFKKDLKHSEQKKYNIALQKLSSL